MIEALPLAVRQELPLLAAVVLIALLLNVPGLRWALYPFRLFATWAHECGHAVAARLVGGRVEGLRIHADGSGLALTRVPSGRLAVAAVASAGYLGTAAAGGVLLAIRHIADPAVVLVGLGALLLVSVLAWVRNLVGLLAVPSLGILLLAAGTGLDAPLARLLVTGIAASLALNTVTSLRHLFGREGLVDGVPHPSDAQLMAGVLWLPAPVWAAGWLVLAVAVLLAGLLGPMG